MPFVFFDAYGTIVELDDFFGRLRAGFADHEVALPPEVVEAAARCEMSHYVQHSVRARDWASYHTLRAECAGVLANAVREAGHRLDLPDAVVVDILAQAIAFRTYPDTLPALQALHRHGVPIAVLSNWDFQITAELEKLGLTTYCEFIQSSSEVGHAKPAPEFFAAALQVAGGLHPGLDPGDCWYVGDSYTNDIVGAHAAGMKPLWIERDAAKAGADPAPAVARLRSLTEIPAILGLE